MKYATEERIGERFKYIREHTAGGISQEEFAELLGLPKSTYNNYESSFAFPKFGTVLELMELVGRNSVFYILTGDKRYVREGNTKTSSGMAEKTGRPVVLQSSRQNDRRGSGFSDLFKRIFRINRTKNGKRKANKAARG